MDEKSQIYKSWSLVIISVLILKIAIEIPIKIKATVIIIKGVIMEGSMLGLDNLLMVAG